MKAVRAKLRMLPHCSAFFLRHLATVAFLFFCWGAVLNAQPVWRADLSEKPSAEILADPEPNLTPYKPTGWSDKIVVAKITGTVSDTPILLPTDGLYIDWAVENRGGASTSTRFHVQLFVNDVLRSSWYADPPIAPAGYVYIQDYFIGALPLGTNRIRIKADSAAAVPESDESDNEYVKAVVIRSPTPSIRVEPLTLTFSGSRSTTGLTFGAPNPLQEMVELQTGTMFLRPGFALDPQAPSTAPSVGPTRHVLLQFARVASEDERKTLRKLGIDLLRSLGGSVYWASLSGSSATTLASVQEAGGIRSATRSSLVDKLSPTARADGFGPHARIGSLTIVVEVLFHSDVSPAVAQASISRAAGRLERWSGPHAALVSIQRNQLETLASADEVEWVQPAPGPKKEVNKVASEHGHATELRAAPYYLSGTDVTVGVWDGGVVGSHPDFGTRVGIKDSASPVGNHATHVAGTIGGAGSGDVNALGMAPGVLLQSYDWDDDSFEMRESTSENVRLSNHSYGYLAGWEWDGTQWVDYGSGSFGAYGASSSEWDDLVFDTGLIVFKAAGNDRNDGPDVPTGPRRDGPYDCIDESGCGKNIITIGATTDSDGMTYFSSWGPVDDGRVKPDLCANGDSLRSTLPGGAYGWMSGTSMATPAACGAGALLFQLHRQLFASDLRADLCKALLIHGASDLGRAGPDYEYGWGLIHARASADLLNGRRFRKGAVANGSVETYKFSVPPNAQALKATLAWTDPAASPLAARALVNDLDIYLMSPSGSIVRPWVLDPLNPSAIAMTGLNTRDNVEQVLVSSPAAGEWTLYVQGTSVPLGPQAFALLCDFLPAIGAQNEFAIHNDGGADLNVTAITLDEPASYVTWSPSAPFIVPPGASRTVTVVASMTNAPAGTTIRRLLLASSDTSKNPYPGGVYLSFENSKPVVTVESLDPTGAETSLTPNPCTLLVRRTGSLAAPLTVGVTLTGTASSGEDYQPVPSSITIPPGLAVVPVTIQALDDERVEPAETVRLTLSAGAEYELGDSPSAEAVIEDDDVCCLETLVVSTTPGTDRSNYSGFVGQALQIGPLPIEIQKLGRMMMPGNTGTHRLKLVHASDGTDVIGGAATLGMTGGIAGQFKYAPLQNPVILEPRTTYYLVSQEVHGGDTWQNVDARVNTTGAATITGGIYGAGAGRWYSYGGPGKAYGPLDLRFKFATRPWTIQVSTRNLPSAISIAVTPADNTGHGGGVVPFTRTFNQGTMVTLSAPAKVDDMAFSHWQINGTNASSEPAISIAADADRSLTAVYMPSCIGPWITATCALGPLRNDYDGYVGLKFEVGGTPIRVTHLGRFKASGNNALHGVKLVQASTGLEVPGCSALVSMADAAPGTFAYATLESPVTLAANTKYFLVSRERASGDQWHDVGSTIETTPAASIQGGIYGSGNGQWFEYGGPGTGYGPVALKYDVGCSPRTLSVAAAGAGTAVTITVSPADALSRADGTAPFDRSYAFNSEVRLSAPQLAAGSTFLKWICDGVDASNNTEVTVRMSSNCSLTAVYRSGDEVRFVTNTITGTLRSNYNGYVGMRVAVGEQDITVTRLGRYRLAGNQRAHRVKVVDALTRQDLPGASVVLDAAIGPAGDFQYGALPMPVTLKAGATYYFVSQETSGADAWQDVDAAVFTRGVASVEGGVYGSGSGTWFTYGARGRSYVPVDFMYSVPAAAPQPFIISQTPGRLRRDYHGFVGMKIQVGAAPLEVLDLGRFMTAGNTGAHYAKIVSAATGLDVPGGGVTISMQGGPPGMFVYGPLQQPISLEAGAAYYIVSRETAGGDAWYDGDTIVNATAAAQVSTGVYGNGTGVWYLYGAAGRSYVPVNFRYRSRISSTQKMLATRTLSTDPLRITLHRKQGSDLQFFLTRPGSGVLWLETSTDLSSWHYMSEVRADLMDLQIDASNSSPQQFFRLVPAH